MTERGIGAVPLALVALLALGACETAAPAAIDGSPSPIPSVAPLEPVAVLFIKDLSVPDADEHALPAARGAALAFATAQLAGSASVPVELEEVDLAQEPEALAEAAADPAFVAAIVAPGVSAEALGLPADLPVIALSGLGERPVTAFARLVPRIEPMADAVAARLRGTRPCILSEDPAPDPLGDLLAERIRRATHALIDPATAASVVTEAGCDVVVWAGGPDAAAEAAAALESSGLPFVGGDRLLDPDFLATAGPAAEGALALCACADVSTSTDLAARRFIQDYQSEHGAAPGAYAVEGWDAARLLLSALGGGAPTREQMAARLAGLSSAEGLARGYRFEPGGELARPRSFVRVYRVEGGRWMRVLAAGPEGLAGLPHKG